MHQTNEETRRINTTDIVFPPEAAHVDTAALPITMPMSPMDMPVERFSQALERREDNRKSTETKLNKIVGPGTKKCYGQGCKRGSLP